MGKKSELPQILGLIALIVVLVLGVKVLFSSLSVINSHSVSAGQTTELAEPGQSTESSPSAGEENGAEAPSFCPYCGKQLPSAFQWGQFCPFCGEQVQA